MADHASIDVGSRVLVRGDSWTVRSVTDYADCQALRLTGCGSGIRAAGRTFLFPFDRVRSCESATRIRVCGRRGWAHHIAQALTVSNPFGGLRHASRAKIDLLPFQLEAALAMLRHGRLRILIADEVGLGKTVQAGIILNELAYEDSGFRAIVLCPAGLREQWQRELSSKFSLESTVADTTWLVECARELPADVNPWSLPGIYVASLDLVKRAEVFRAIENVTWDVAVMDEVHALGLATARLAAARAIGARARRIVLMTATAPDGDAPHLAAITGVGRISGEPPVTEFRRTRRDAGIEARRKTTLLAVRLSSAETRMHRLLERYTSLVWAEATARGDHAARLAAMVLRKRALSSAGSLGLSVRRRLTILGTAPGDTEHQLLLPLGDEDPVPDGVPDDVMAASGLADVGVERECLAQIAISAEDASQSESKIRALVRLLARIREPAIVFTEYRDTLLRIAAALRLHSNVAMLHGGMLPRERVLVQRRFNRSGTLLLATDAASEGLNLHERCRLVIHFELPWTPMRLEQRTGRVDRLGQTRPVHELLLVARDTAERFVLAPLVKRVRATAARGGSARSAFDESIVAELVLGDTLSEPPQSSAAGVPRTSIALGTDAQAERDRLTLLRTLRPRTTRLSDGADLIVHVRRRSDLEPNHLAVCRLALKDSTGRSVHSEIVAVRIACGEGPVAAPASAIRSWTTRIGGNLLPALVAAVSDHRHTSIALVRHQCQQVLQALAVRERAIVAALPAARTLVQAGLFDRRALRTAASRDAAAALLTDEAERRLRALDEEGRLKTEVRLISLRWDQP